MLPPIKPNDMTFDLNAWGSEERPTSYTYTVVGVSDNALKVKRNDRAATQTFSKKTFVSLKKEGRLHVNPDGKSFRLDISGEWDPESQFTPLD